MIEKVLSPRQFGIWRGLIRLDPDDLLTRPIAALVQEGMGADRNIRETVTELEKIGLVSRYSKGLQVAVPDAGSTLWADGSTINGNMHGDKFWEMLTACPSATIYPRRKPGQIGTRIPNQVGSSCPVPPTTLRDLARSPDAISGVSFVLFLKETECIRDGVSPVGLARVQGGVGGVPEAPPEGKKVPKVYKNSEAARIALERAKRLERCKIMVQDVVSGPKADPRNDIKVQKFARIYEARRRPVDPGYTPTPRDFMFFAQTVNWFAENSIAPEGWDIYVDMVFKGYRRITAGRCLYASPQRCNSPYWHEEFMQSLGERSKDVDHLVQELEKAQIPEVCGTPIDAVLIGFTMYLAKDILNGELSIERMRVSNPRLYAATHWLVKNWHSIRCDDQERFEELRALIDQEARYKDGH